MDLSELPSPPEKNSFGPFSLSVLKGDAALAKLKNITLADVRFFIEERQAEVLCVLVAFVTVFACVSLIKTSLQKMQQADQEMSALKEKTAPVEDYFAAVKRVKVFLADVPAAVEDNKFITQLTLLSKKRNIQIASFAPPVVDTKDLYTKATVSVSCSVPSFRDALSFLYDLEHSPYSLRVESWKIKRADGRRADYNDFAGYLSDQRETALGMDMTISTIDVTVTKEK